MPEILHVSQKAKWERAVAEGEYQGDTLATEGFIHCCSPGQLSGVISRYFKGHNGLVILRIDPSKLGPPLKWESPPGSEETFPHVYGPLTLGAVVEVVTLVALLFQEAED